VAKITCKTVLLPFLLVVFLHHSVHSQLVVTRDANKVDSLLSLATEPKEIADLSIELYQAYKYNKLEELPNEGAYLIRALEIYDSLGLPEQAAYTHNSLAGMYYNRGQIQDAKENWEKALELYQSTNNTRRIGVMYNNLSHAYNKDTAANAQALRMEYLQKAIEIHAHLKDTSSLLLAYGNVGHVYLEKNEPKRAKEYYDLALDLALKINNPYRIETAYINLGKVKMSTNELEEAIALFEKALTYEQIRNTDPLVSDTYWRLAACYRKLGDHNSADKNMVQFAQIQGELFEKEKTNQLLELETKYNTEKKEQEIEQLRERELIQQQALEAELRLRYALIAIAILSILGLAVIAVLFRRTKHSEIEIARQKESLEKLNATKDRFFGIIAHDLRNPVISFQGIAKLIDSYLKKGKTEKISELSGKIQHSVNNLNQLLDNLLNWASSQTSALPYNPEPLAVSRIIDESISLFSDTADAKQIIISSNVDAEVMIYADRNGVSTIFRNLINNAVKFTPEGGKIKIAAELDGNNVKVVTTDNGVGIDQSKISSLFQLSNNKSTQGTSGEKGTGLGLVLCQEFAKVNKGLIWVESELSKGSSFYVSIPKFTE